MIASPCDFGSFWCVVKMVQRWVKGDLSFITKSRGVLYLLLFVYVQVVAASTTIPSLREIALGHFLHSLSGLQLAYLK